MRHSAGGIVLLVAGIFLLASAMHHGMGNVPHLREDMVEIGVRPTLLKSILLVLYFSVVAMFAFAAVVLAAAVKSSRGGQPETASLWIVAASYALSGVGAYAFVGRSPHFLGYAAIGLFVALGAFFSRD
jgi:hypothetical protein